MQKSPRKQGQFDYYNKNRVSPDMYHHGPSFALIYITPYWFICSGGIYEGSDFL
jgi:hypothetical protein